MQRADNEFKNTKEPVHIRFEDEDFGLSWEYLQQQADLAIARRRNWRYPELQFLSFKDGQFVLQNNNDGQSYKLSLQVTNNELLVTCSCDGERAVLCEHAYNALRSISFYLGQRYFQKLQPRGLMELAFTHAKFFNKVESREGLNVSPRSELKTVYKLSEKAKHIDLPAMMALPGTVSENNLVSGEQALSYVVILPSRHRFLPAVIPCMGKLNKAGTAIRSFDKFLSGLQKEYAGQLTYNQRELNKACYGLWKTIEPLPGSLVAKEERKKVYDHYLAIWSAWQHIIPLLQKQPYVYAYYSYNIRDLKGKPRMARTMPVQISGEPPTLRFVLTEKTAFYQLELQIWAHNTLLEKYYADAPFFILYGRTLYMLESFRDAVITEWMCHAEGCITIFKEHFAEFEKEWLNPLRANYPVEVIAIRKTTKKAP